jgi:hypothetical protein
VPAPPELAAFMIELSIDGAPALVLVLSADGAVNRGGSGKAHPVEKDVFIQQTDGAFFRELVTLFDPSWLEGGDLRAPGSSRSTSRAQIVIPVHRSTDSCVGI